MGVWIEMSNHICFCRLSTSLPSWECGLKYLTISVSVAFQHVTPFVGVWIEIFRHTITFEIDEVTPFVGVWIEITDVCSNCIRLLSLPSWECGLK